ncbi:MAG: sulfite exporter TauE/SafE family protein [Chloroflexi bacterium]|nr:sulfite exporter TauE/SafE family protein [Chloroflexota bacterium]
MVILVALGFAVGTYGTLIGAGGGFLLVPVLLFMYPRDNPGTITSISLVVVFFNALSGSFAYGRMKRIDYRSGALFALATIPGAILGALAVSLFSRGLFSVVFGVVLVGISLFSFWRSRENAGPAAGVVSAFLQTRTLQDYHGQRYTYAFDLRIGLGLSFVVGFFSSLLGIGGGIIHVPAMAHLLYFPAHIATATSQFVLAIMAFTGSSVHVLTGQITQGTGLIRALLLSAGALLGAQVGARLSERVRGTWLLRLLALALVLVGLRLVISGLVG